MKTINLFLFSFFALCSCDKLLTTDRSVFTDVTKSTYSESGNTPSHREFIAEMPPSFKTVLFYEKGRPEWAAADRVWISDGKAELVYSAGKGGGLETTLSYHRLLKGERLADGAELVKAVYPLSYGVCGGFPEVQEYCMSDRNFVIPIYAEKTPSDEKLRFCFISGLLNIPAEVKAEKGIESLYFMADEPLSGEAVYSYSFPCGKAELKGDAGVTLKGNVMKGNIVLSIALPEGEYHNLKAVSPSGEEKEIGDFTIVCGKITEYTGKLVFD